MFGFYLQALQAPSLEVRHALCHLLALLGTLQSVPWGLAYHVAAQREAAGLGLPLPSSSSYSGRKRKALGVHQGPAAFTKNRNRAGGPGDPGESSLLRN